MATTLNRRFTRLLGAGLAGMLSVGTAAQRGGGPPGAQAPARDVPRITTGTGVIAGTIVLDGADARPVRRATVTVSSTDPRSTRLAVTDDQGRFAVRDLPPGRFNVMASKPGYLSVFYGATRPWRGPAQPIALADGQQVTDLALKMQRGAVVTGNITDQLGQPQASAQVVVMESRIVNGEQTLGYVGGNSRATTDDRGEFRAYGLPPGTYVLAASISATLAANLTTAEEIQWAQQQGQPGARPLSVGTASAGPEPGQLVGYAPVFYPGTTDSSHAATITVRAGEERTGMSFAIQYVPTAKVEGVITRADGRPVQGTQLFLFANTRTSMVPFLESPFANRVILGADGRFTFRSVRPGEYTLTARASSRPGRAGGPPVMDLWALVPVTMAGQDQAGLSAQLQEGMTVSGRVAFEAQTLTPPTDLARVSINLRVPPTTTGVSIGVPASNATADGTFTFEGVTPGRYSDLRERAGAAGNGAGIELDAQVGHAEGSGCPRFAPRRQTRRERLRSRADVHRPDHRDQRSAPRRTRPALAGYFVFVFPTDKTSWYQGSRRMRPPTRPASDGKYRITGLPPGDYYVAALTDFEPNDIFDASFLDQLIGASFKITLGEGEKKTQDLKLSGGIE